MVLRLLWPLLSMLLLLLQLFWSLPLLPPVLHAAAQGAKGKTIKLSWVKVWPGCLCITVQQGARAGVERTGTDECEAGLCSMLQGNKCSGVRSKPSFRHLAACPRLYTKCDHIQASALLLVQPQVHGCSISCPSMFLTCYRRATCTRTSRLCLIIFLPWAFSNPQSASISARNFQT